MPGSLGKTGLTKSSCLLMLGDGYNTSVVLHMSKSLPFFFFLKALPVVESNCVVYNSYH